MRVLVITLAMCELHVISHIDITFNAFFGEGQESGESRHRSVKIIMNHFFLRSFRFQRSWDLLPPIVRSM